MPDPSNRRRFVDYIISMIRPSKIICYQSPSGLTIDSFIYSLPVTLIRGHPIEGKFNQYTLICLCGNTSGPIDRVVLVNLSLDGSGAFINYFRSSVTEFWDSINIFIIIVGLLIPIMVNFLVQ